VMRTRSAPGTRVTQAESTQARKTMEEFRIGESFPTRLRKV
jgi:hypothetical protein